jgi:hypothetical protein
MHCKSLGRYIALGIDVGVERRSRRDSVQELDAPKLNDTVTLAGIEAGGFGIENDLAHEDFAAESLALFRHCSNAGKNITYLSARGIKSPGCIHHEIRARTLVGVRHLFRENGA